MFHSQEEYYDGHWREGDKEGSGHLVSKFSRCSYVGEFVRSRKQGKGRMVFGDGSVYSGQFEADLPSGEGTLEYRNKDIYRGGFREGRK